MKITEGPEELIFVMESEKEVSEIANLFFNTQTNFTTIERYKEYLSKPRITHPLKLTNGGEHYKIFKRYIRKQKLNKIL